MSLATLAVFLVFVALAAYMQTVTGFAFGLILMGLVGLTGILPLKDAAVLTSILLLVNAAQMAFRGWRDVARRELGLVVVTSLPGSVAGYALLEYLSGEHGDAIRLILGLVIIGASLQFASGPATHVARSGALSFLAFGAISGLMSGMFATGGPPLIYHLHRQPLPRAMIRETLVVCFGFAAVVRLVVVVASGTLPPPSTFWGLLGIPVVIALTALGRGYPPPLSPAAFRHVVVGLLLLSGLALAAPALAHMGGRLA